MVAEIRASRIDIHARSRFVGDGEVIAETREAITKALDDNGPPDEVPADSRKWAAAAEDGQIETG